MARKAGGILKPGDLDRPGLARDPGVRANFAAPSIPKRIDPRGAALEDLARGTAGVADATSNLAATTRKGGTMLANAVTEVAKAQSNVGEATVNGADVVANAQQMFARSVGQIGDVFERLGAIRKQKQDELAVERWALNNTQNTLGFQQDEQANPNPKKLQGKAYLDDVDSRYSKVLDDTTKQTEDELGFAISGDAKDKITALGYRARAQAMENAASAEHERTVTAMYESAQEDAIKSGKQVGQDGDIGAGIARGESITNRVQGVVTPDKYLAFKMATRKDAYAQGIRYYLAKGDIASAEAITSQLTGIAGQNADATTSAITDAFKAEGVDQTLGLAIAYRETGGTFNPTIKTFIDPITGKRASSASGLFQMTDAMSRAYIGPVAAGDSSVENQAKAGAKLTADNIKGLQRVLGAQPTPGEVYLAHVLGLNKAAAIITADPSTPLSAVLSDKEIRNSAPKLLNGTAGDMRQWSQDAMQTSMEAVVNNGLMQGVSIPDNLAGLPIDEAASMWKEVQDTKDKMSNELAKRDKEFIDAFVPIKSRNERDPAAFVMQYSGPVSKAFAVADAVKADPNSTWQDRLQATTRAFTVSIDEQKLLAQSRGVPFSERDAKLLSIPQAKAVVNSFTEAKGPDAVKQFYQLRDETGTYWPKVLGELSDQGLSPAFQILGILDPTRDPAQVNAVTQTLGVSMTDMRKDLGSASNTIDADLFNPIENGLSDFRQAYEFGPFASGAKGQATGIIDAAKMVGLNTYRLTGDLSKSIDAATKLITDNVNVVTGAHLRAMIPREANLSDTEVEAATEYMQDPQRIEDFNPLTIGVAEQKGEGDLAKDQAKFLRDRTLSAAQNSGIWATNDRGDGLTLLVPIGDGTSYTRLFNAKGEPFEIKFADIPALAQKNMHVAPKAAGMVQH